MDIDKILNDLGLDLSNPETKKGAIEAIEAILGSRASGGLPGAGMGGGMGGETDVEVDPDLLRPSMKNPMGGFDGDIEINDEEDILSQVKQNDSEEKVSSGDTSANGEGSSSSSQSDSDDSNSSSSSDTDSTSNSDKTDSDDTTNFDKAGSDDEENFDDEADSTDGDASDDSSNTESEDEDDFTAESESDFDSEIDSAEDTADDDEEDSDEFDGDDIDGSQSGDSEGDSKEEADEESESDAENDFNEDDLLDNTYNDLKDFELKTKHEARKIKRERTLAAAKKALADAQARKVAPALIRELEKAIEDLESLTEAVKSIKDISDEEFNLKINRVFDAIDAVGDKSLTFSSDEERQLKAQEIKADLAKAETKNELSAEDVAKIRAEHQAVQAREKDLEKYKIKARGSFKGFQDFLQSLYRAVALQVAVEETRDDSWSAISRRNSGAGVLKQGKKINELPNRKIPVIDFYFDQSGSWSDKDIKVGEKALQSLADMEADGKIKVNTFYFSDDVFTDAASARAAGGTSGWNEIVKNIISTQATNVIIMTDSDMENWWNGPKALSYTIPGYVWYLWRDGVNAPRLPRDLKGKGGTMQYSFSASDA